MSEKHIVFNDQLELYVQRYISNVAPIPLGEDISEDIQKRKLLALLFEQFLLFDKIAIKIDVQNFELYFLIKELGINKVEELLDYGIIKLVLWTPAIIMTTGTELPDGTIDNSTIMGRPPLISGWISDEFSNPERNIDRLLSYFSLHKDRKKTFKKKALKQFVLPDNSIAEKATEIVLDAYLKNRLADLGLRAEKAPEFLDLIERDKLFKLGHQVLETSVLAEKGFKSYDNYSLFNLTKNSVRYIESAYHVSENTSEILKIENLANIQQLVFENKIPFDRVFDMRYQPDVKHYRKWINSISVNTDARNITKEYIDQVIGKNKFFESTGGKFVRTVGMFGIGTGLGSMIAGPSGAIAGGFLGKASDLGLALLDTYVLDGILKGWNPRMFVDKIKEETDE